MLSKSNSFMFIHCFSRIAAFFDFIRHEVPRVSVTLSSVITINMSSSFALSMFLLFKPV